MQRNKRASWYLLGCLACLVAVAGCGWFTPPPPGGTGQWGSVEKTTSPSDPKLKTVAEDWQRWILEQAPTPGGAPLFSRAELLPVTVTTLPYGVGAYQQQPRWPVILTTGPGWSALKREQKEKQ